MTPFTIMKTENTAAAMSRAMAKRSTELPLRKNQLGPATSSGGAGTGGSSSPGYSGVMASVGAVMPHLALRRRSSVSVWPASISWPTS